MKTKPSSKADWGEPVDSASALLKRGIFMDIVGLEGQGKSSLALTLAHVGPIGYADIDQSFDRAKRPDGKKIDKRIKVLPVRYAVSPSEEETKRICGQAWLNMAERVDDAAKTWAKGVVIDTGTEDWELIRLGSFGTLNPKGNRMDRLYGPVNARYRMHLRGVHRTSLKHLVTIHQLKDEYKDVMSEGKMQSIKTGKHNPAGFKEIGYMADLRVRCYREKNEFKAKIELCKLPPMGPALEGMELEDDQIDFAYIVALATGTEREDWLAK